MLRKWWRSFLVVLAIAAAFALGAQVQDQLGISFSLEGLAGFQQWVANLGWLGPVVFVTLVIFRIFIGLSSHVVLILGGLAFGAVGGIAWGSLGLLASALLVFFAARLLGDDWVRPRLGKRYAALSARIERAGAGAIFALTAHPVGPLMPVQLAAGLVGLPLWKFTLAVAIAAPIRAAVYSLLGTAVLTLSPAESIAIAAGLVGLFVVPLLIPSVRAWLMGVDAHEQEK